MASSASILISILLFSFPHLTFAVTDNRDECSCFRTNGSSPGYFLNHQFHDYRDIAGASSPPALTTNATNATNAFATSSFFLGDTWKSGWTAQNWNNSDRLSSGASVLMVNTPNNVYIGIEARPSVDVDDDILTRTEQSNDSSQDYTSFLTLRTARHETFQSVAEIDSNEQDFQYMSARFMARVIGSPGACAGIFTYRAGDTASDVQEADIEILTRDPRNRVQYTNQPSVNRAGEGAPQATVNGTNPGERDWTLWNVYRVDWMPGMTSWYVNGESVANIGFQTPRDPAGLIVNMWSDGGVWTGNMSLFDEAFLQIQWIELVYNTSGPYEGLGNRKRDGAGASGELEKRRGTPGCKVVCGIDEKVNITGTPALLYNNTGDAMMGWRAEGMGAVWIPLVLVCGAAFGFL